ncbi:MAG: glycosyltransferase family 2 protein [Lachnospiraceae bacterium]|nr:glycosyltransferase family 2 protein [Lachnospiraceae bacterium]
MREIIVSVIIPVYKTEEYLAECMESVFKQDYPNIEIILVDDGSPDNCPKLCDDYASNHINVKVVHKANSGLGLSRNAGMKVAAGKYIFFLDSDDCLDEKETLSKLVECAEKEGADIVIGSFRRFSEKGHSEPNDHHLKGGEYTKTADFRFKGFYMYGHLAYNWGKLYRKEFLDKHELYCDAYPFTQDKAHNMRCCAYEPVYAFISDSVYLYRVNEESVTFKYKSNFMPVWIAIAEDFEIFLKERGITRDYNDLMYFHIFFGSFFLAKQELQFKEKGIWEAFKTLKTYGKNPFVKRSMNALAKGRYLKGIDSLSWKLVIRGASVLFSLHGYWLMAVGIALLRKMELDSKITKSRYQKKESQ